MTNISLDFDASDRSTFLEQDPVNGTEFVNGKIQLKGTPTEVLSDKNIAAGNLVALSYVHGGRGGLSDGNINSDWHGWYTNPQWGAYTFPEPKRIGKLRIYPSYLPGCPSQIKVYGSNDQGAYNTVNWTLIDTKSSLTWNNAEWKEVLIQNPQFYKHYAVHFLYSSYGYIVLGELELYDYFKEHPVEPKYVTTTDQNHFPLDIVGKINSVTINSTIPTNTSIKCLISFDNRLTWKYKSGSNWLEAPNGLLDLETLGMTPVEAKNALSGYTLNFPDATEEAIDWAFSLKTTDLHVTPSIDQITYNYNERSHFELCTVGRYGSNTDYGVKRVNPTTTRFKKQTSGTTRTFVSVICGAN